MAKVMRNYQHMDYSQLLNELNGSSEDKPAEGEPQPEKKAKKSGKNEVSPAKRKRDSLMSDQRMRYAYSESQHVLHDRDCARVSKIKNKDFRMTQQFITEMECCKECYRRALVRAGLEKNDAKMINAYLNVFNLFGATNKDLHRLMIENEARLCGVDLNSVYIKVREDKWLIRQSQGKLLLFHNNYDMIGETYERLLRTDFHLQQRGTGEGDFFKFVGVVCGYSWQAHVKRMKAQEMEHRKQQLREELAGVSSFIRIKRFSLLYDYYWILDCNGKAPRFFARNGVSAKWLGYHIHDEVYTLKQCRVPRFHRRRFCVAMEALKDYGVLREYWDYAEKCTELLHGSELQ